MNKDKICLSCDTCNKRSPLFASLTNAELLTLNMDRHSVKFKAGEVILKQGTRSDSMISIVEGFTKLYIEGNHGKNLVLDFVKPWRLVGGPGAKLEGKHRYSLMAIQDTLVCFIDQNNLQKVLASNHKFSEEFLVHCSGNYLSALNRLVTISQKQMHGRVADALIYLSESIFEGAIIGGEISRQDIADYSSMTKDSAIRVLKEFERDEIINLVDRKIELLDSKRLHEISDKG